MEPGTFKDRVLIHADPHQIIEGIIIAGYATSAEYGIVFIRPEYENAARILEREIALAKKEGYLGKNLLGNHNHHSTKTCFYLEHKNKARYKTAKQLL